MNGKIIYIEKLSQTFKHRVVIYDFDKNRSEHIKDVYGINGAFRIAKGWQETTGLLVRIKSGQNLSKPTDEEIKTYGIIA